MRRKTAFIHDRTAWPTLTWDAHVLAPPLAAVHQKLGRLLGTMSSIGFELRAEAGLDVLTTEVVKSSAIEGDVLSAVEVRSSIAQQLGLDVAGTSAASRDVDGVVAMMLDATRNVRVPLTSDRLFGWHGLLFPTGRSGFRRIAVGAWRSAESGPMRVVSGPAGRERTHFEAPTADRLESEMAALFAWFNAANSSGASGRSGSAAVPMSSAESGPPTSIDPVLKAGIAHFWFVTIHPFEDGNGRVARAIADMALGQADGADERFYSMSSQIEAERADYYRELEAAQRGDVDITAWLVWFVACLDRAIDGADRTMAAVLSKARIWRDINRQPVNDRQRLVISRMLDTRDPFTGFLSTSKYAKLAKCSADTALRDIHGLVERGVLAQNAAGGRSTSYRVADWENIGE